MTRRALIAASAYALGTFGLTLATFWPGSLQATGENAGLSSTIQRPVLKINGCELSLLRDAEDAAPALKEGDRPAFKLLATNPGQKEIEVKWTVALTYRSPASALSRVPVAPRSLWQKTDTLVLLPYETRTVELPTDTALPKGAFTLALASGNQRIVALQFSTGAIAAPLNLSRVAQQVNR